MRISIIRAVLSNLLSYVNEMISTLCATVAFDKRHGIRSISCLIFSHIIGLSRGSHMNLKYGYKSMFVQRLLFSDAALSSRDIMTMRTFTWMF
jgi:hypothetical protein